VRLFCVCVALCLGREALRQADPPSKEYSGLCIRSRDWKSGQSPTKGCRAIIIIITIIITSDNNSNTIIILKIFFSLRCAHVTVVIARFCLRATVYNPQLLWNIWTEYNVFSVVWTDIAWEKNIDLHFCVASNGRPFPVILDLITFRLGQIPCPRIFTV
jgi:hypothetical protein